MYKVCLPSILSNALFSFVRSNPLNSYEQVDNEKTQINKKSII